MITANFIAWLDSQSVADLEAGIACLEKCDLADALRSELSARKPTREKEMGLFGHSAKTGGFECVDSLSTAI